MPRHPSAGSLGQCDHLAAARDFAFCVHVCAYACVCVVCECVCVCVCVYDRETTTTQTDNMVFVG